MSIAPINFYSGYGLVPVFEWVPVEPAQHSTNDAAPTPVIADGTAVDTQCQPTGNDTSPQMRLVFKGFEWRATAGIATYPRPDWMGGLASGCDDPSDPSTKHDDRNTRIDELARARKAALAAAQQPDSAPLDGGPKSQNASDPD